jgi:hypothetical protein
MGQARAKHGLVVVKKVERPGEQLLPKMLSKVSHNNAQQDESDKAPKYPSPRLMTAAIDSRFFGFPVH